MTASLLSPRRSVIVFLVLVLLLPASLPPVAARQQVDRPGLAVPATFLQGYVRSVSGEVLVYPWAYPGQVETLLSRATDGSMAVEWEGAPVPAGAAADQVTYLWHAGTASGYGAHTFSLSVNGRLCATFRSGRTASDREWTVVGREGSTLSFKTTRVGAFNELFGFMWLTAPRSFFGSSAPRFTVVGEAAGNQDYYLGQKKPVEAWVRVRPEEAVLTGGRRAIRLEASVVGSAATLTLRSGSATLWTGRAEPGHTSLLLPAGPNDERRLALQADMDGRPVLDETLSLKPVRLREVHLLPHSHIDIGYSDPQPQVERKQWKNLASAVELARKTAGYPAAARFKWNVEGLWSVESYLKQASAADREAFVDAVKAGSIGLQANYTNVLTGLMTPEELRHWTDAARQIETTYGVGPIRSAMHSDIPGLSWTVVAALAQAGVRYFSSGPNYVPGFPDLGDRIGSTLRALGDKPFWWRSPSGEERVLFWMAGHGYSWFHGLNNGSLTSTSRDTVLDYVRELVAGGYQWDLIQTRYTIGGDNGPTDPNLPDIVKDWNAQFETPRLVINTAEALFAELERRHGPMLPVMSGDMTPYWEDGALSTAREEAMVRAAARRLAQAQTLFALRSPATSPRDALTEAWRNVLLWHEHTWGAADSISQPDRADVVAQWEYKRAFAVEADRQSRAIHESAASGSGGAIDVINTLAWPRNGVVLLSPAQSKAGDRVRDGGGRLRPTQRLRDGRLAVWLESVPPLGAIRLRVEPGAATPPSAAAVQASTAALDNGRSRAEFDPVSGVIARLVGLLPMDVLRTGSAQTPRSSTPPRQEYPLGAGLLDYLYVPGRDPGEAQRPPSARISLTDQGPLLAAVRVESEAPGAASLVRTVQMVAGSDDILMTVDLDKRKVRTKEGAHLAFPLTLPDGVIRLDLGEALIVPGKDQLPGSCSDFVGVSSTFDVTGNAAGVSVASLDAPLIELGAITDERQGSGRVRAWRDRAAPGTTLYAYLLNNYWHTNYKADQEGPMQFRFVLRWHRAFDAASLRRFSDEQDQPLVVVPAGASNALPRAPITVTGGSVIGTLVESVDGGKAVVVRLYNPGAADATATVVPRATGARVSMMDPARSGWRPVTGPLTLPPHATRMLRVDVR